MKRSIKNFAATMMIGGMIFTPIICSADTGKKKTVDKPKVEINSTKEMKSQAEVEAIEEMKKFATISYKKTPKKQIRQDEMIAMTVINKIENFTIAALK